MKEEFDDTLTMLSMYEEEIEKELEMVRELRREYINRNNLNKVKPDEKIKGGTQ